MTLRDGNSRRAILTRTSPRGAIVTIKRSKRVTITLLVGLALALGLVSLASAAPP